MNEMTEHVFPTIGRNIEHYEYPVLIGRAREEIVRCGSCGHFERTAVDGICHRSEFWPMHAEPDGFCAWPKRKEGDDA